MRLNLHPSARKLSRRYGVLALTREQAEFLAERVGEDRVFTVPHGVDTTYFAPTNGGPPPRPRDPPVSLLPGSWPPHLELPPTPGPTVRGPDPAAPLRRVADPDRLPATAQP